MRNNSKGFASVLVLVLIVLAGVGYFIYKGNKPKSQITGTNSQVVTTSPTAVSTPTPAPTGKITENKESKLKTYTNIEYHYTVSYPSHLAEDLTNYPGFIVENYDTGTMGAPGYPLFYITILKFADYTSKNGSLALAGQGMYNDDGFANIPANNDLWTLPVGASKKIINSPGDTDTYTRLPDIVKDGVTGKSFKMVNSIFNVPDIRIFFIRKDGLVYMVGIYDNSAEFQKIFDSFKFTN